MPTLYKEKQHPPHGNVANVVFNISALEVTCHVTANI